MKTADFNKNPDGLLPAIIQDSKTQKVLMLGYMNAESLRKTQNSGKVTFYSRSKKRLWTKGEESGNFLYLVDIAIDCDLDTFLIKVKPKGPTCHTGTDTCWGEENIPSLGFILTVLILFRYKFPRSTYVDLVGFSNTVCPLSPSPDCI